MRPRRLVSLAAILGCISTAARAYGEPGRAELSIDCPALDPDALALLEARARADLLGESRETGSVAIACTASTATLTRRTFSGAQSERTVTLSQEPAAAVDTLLDALDALLSEIPILRAEEAPTPPAPSAEPIPPPTLPSVSAPAATSEAAASRPPGHRSLRLSATAGAFSELWHGGILGAIGAHAGGKLALSDRWTVVGTAGPAWGVASASGMHAWTLRADLRVDYEVLRHVVVGAGATGRILWATGAPAVLPSSQSGTTGGGLVTARCELSAGPLALSFGPELEALVRPVAVELGESEAFRVPTFVVGISLDATIP